MSRYDAALTTDNNRRHWANAGALSVDAAASADVRRTLRNRARHEVAKTPTLAASSSPSPTTLSAPARASDF